MIYFMQPTTGGPVKIGHTAGSAYKNLLMLT